MRRDSGWLALAVLLVLLAGCSSWWTPGAGPAGQPCVSDTDSLRARDSLGACRATPRAFSDEGRVP